MKTHKEALTALVHEMEYVLSCINADKVPFDGDDFHEALRLGKEALAQPEHEKYCSVCQGCGQLDTGIMESPVTICNTCNGTGLKEQPEQEPETLNYTVHVECKRCGSHERYDLEIDNPQRTWVGLTDEEIDQGLLRSDYAFKTAEAWRAGVVFAMTKLKEKNT